MYLIDTNVISELKRRSPAPAVQVWMSAQHSSDLYVSVITLLDLQVGIINIANKDARRAARFRKWYQQRVLVGFRGRILPADTDAVDSTAPLRVPKTESAHDALIAGTAIARGFTFVTRNVRNFQGRGVNLFNPWGEEAD